MGEIRNIKSFGLLRNGYIYSNREQAISEITRAITNIEGNDGVAILGRYLQDVDGGKIVSTVVGFYANADLMDDAKGGASHLTIFDVGGIDDLRAIVGSGLTEMTLTEAARALSAKTDELEDIIGSGFTFTESGATITVPFNSASTVGDAISNMAVTVDVEGEAESGTPTTYVIKRGDKVIARIKQDEIVKEGKVVRGTWQDSGHTIFVESEDGPDTALRLTFSDETPAAYIDIESLIDIYTGESGITVSSGNVISIDIDDNSEEFLTVSESGLSVNGIQEAIDKNKLEASDGIFISSNIIKAVAASYSDNVNGIINPITVDSDGIKFATTLDCGFFDENVAKPESASDITGLRKDGSENLVINNEDAIEALNDNTYRFKSVTIPSGSLDKTVYINAVDGINVGGITIDGAKDGKINGKVNFSAPVVRLSNVKVKPGSTVYNVFEQTGVELQEFSALNTTVDDPELTHNVYNIYRPANNAVISIKDAKVSLNVNNSNVLRLSNYSNATGVTINFENVEWSYEKGPNTPSTDWRWAGLIIYQPASADVALGGDLSKIQTWTFNFKNCKYNGLKVENNMFGKHQQVFYLYNVGGDKSFKDPAANGISLNFS